jgi:diguanylate cyclase (GGDEF)-like protein
MLSFARLARTALYGFDPRQTLRIAQSLLALVVYAVFAVVQHVEVMAGMIDEAHSWRLTAWNLAGGLIFFVFIRSGLNQRVPGDRALTIPQSLWAMVGIAWSYGITGPARGGVILIMLLILNFGMFALRPRQARNLAITGFAMIGSVMVWKALTDPAHYDPRVEAMHFVFAGIVMASVATLSIRIGKLRARLEAQRGELTQALERIQALATCDELTGLTNRRAAMERMQQELAVRTRAEPLMSVALIDLDHFKHINDNHGHAAGDAVLRRFADCARSTVRVGDTMARWGGEEFLLVMPATSSDDAMRGMERLREQLHQQAFDDIAPGLAVSFSAGVAECMGAGDLEAAIERADKAMYQAKHAGRDRAMAAPDLHPLRAVAA